MSSTGPTPCFNTLMLNRQRLLWTVATRRQLERWEPYVAADVLRGYEHRQLDDVDIWLAQIEHHFALVAARNLLRALDLEPVTRVVIDPTPAAVRLPREPGSAAPFAVLNRAGRHGQDRAPRSVPSGLTRATRSDPSRLHALTPVCASRKHSGCGGATLTSRPKRSRSTDNSAVAARAYRPRRPRRTQPYRCSRRSSANCSPPFA
jgi:hypothetical protein